MSQERLPIIESSRRRAQSWPYPRHNVFEKELRKAAAAWFLAGKHPTEPGKPYVLANYGYWPRNIILPEVVEYIEQEQEWRLEGGNELRLHPSIHSGLSSQAMVFNLLGPLVVRSDLDPLRATLEKHDIPWPTGFLGGAAFEIADRDVFGEDTQQPTSIDLGISGTPPLFLEGKLNEREFGGCSRFEGGDCEGRNPHPDHAQCYLHFIGRGYWTLLARYGFLDGPLGSSPFCPLANYYQFFREVLFAIERGGYFVLLVDERNPAFSCQRNGVQRGLLPFLVSLMPSPVQGRVKMITLQDVVREIRQSGRHADWIDSFERKYGLPKLLAAGATKEFGL